MGHARNNKVQSLYWIAGDAYTVDGAIDKALNNREERDSAVATNQATQLAGLARLEGAKTKVLLIERKMAAIRQELGEGLVVTVEGQEPQEDPEKLSPRKRLKREFELEELRIQQCEAASELLQAQAAAETAERSFQKAIEEREALTNLINDLLENSPIRDLWLSDPEAASEVAAMTEATFEFMARIEHSLATQGTLAHDQYRAAMALPTWQSTIRPWLLACKEALADGGLLPESLMVSKSLGHRLLTLAPKEHARAAELIAEEAKFWTLPGASQQAAFNTRPQLAPATQDHVPQLRRPETYQPIALNAPPEEINRVRQQRLASATHDIRALLGPGAEMLMLGSGEGTEASQKPQEAAGFVPAEPSPIPSIFGPAAFPEPTAPPEGDGDFGENLVGCMADEDEVPVPAWHKGTEAEYRHMEKLFPKGTLHQEQREAYEQTQYPPRFMPDAPELKPSWLS